MRKGLLAASASVLATLGLSGGLATATPPSNVVRADVVPVHRDGGKLLGQWWARILSLPPAQATTPRCTRIGRHGNVLAPSGEGTNVQVTCRMSVDTRLFLILESGECSSNEQPPFHGDTAAEQRSCVLAAVAHSPVIAETVAVDGSKPVNMRSKKFLVISPQERTVFAGDPAHGVSPGPGTFVAAGYVATVPRARLRPGRHVIVGRSITAQPSETGQLTIHLTVVGHKHRRHHGRP